MPRDMRARRPAGFMTADASAPAFAAGDAYGGETMFQPVDGASGNVVALEAVGEITDADYKSVLIPRLEEAIKEHGKARVLIWFGPRFEGYAPRAMFDDTMFGIRHWRDFEKIAVVSDIDWIRKGAELFMPMMPAATRSFDNEHADDAMAWVAA
jgi:hypothetical protein